MNTFLKILSIAFLLYQVQLLHAQSCKSSLDLNSTMVGECKNIDECTGAAISSRDCTSSETCCVDDIPIPTPINENKDLTLEIFLKVVGDTKRNRALYYHFVQSMNEADITTNYQKAAYLSQLIGESKYFKKIESIVLEDDNDKQLGNFQKGDGTSFRGRGGILTRGRLNYEQANKRLAAKLNYNIMDNPEYVAFPSVAFKVAAWFWKENAYVIKTADKAKKDSLNELADGTFLSFVHLTHSLTANINSLKERAKLNEQLLSEMRTTTMKRGEGVECELKDGRIGYAVPICTFDFRRPYCGCEGSYEIQTCPYGFLANRKCRNSALIKCCVEMCYSDLDLVILVDSSGSIGQENFEKQKEFLVTLVQQLKIGESASHVGLIEFNNKAKVHIALDSKMNKGDIITKIESLRWRGGTTNTANALELANELFDENKGMRPDKNGVPKVLLTITDGLSDIPPDTKVKANILKKREFNLISVGIKDPENDPRIFLDELLVLSSTPNDQYYLEDFNKIKGIINEITRKTCQQPARLQIEQTVSAKVEKDSYKYFKFPLKNVTSARTAIPEKLTLNLIELSGQSEIFYSFDDPNPKSNESFVQNITNPAKEENFYEDTFRMKRQALRKGKKSTEPVDHEVNFKSTSEKSKSITVENINGKDTLYVSVRGKEKDNSFNVNVLPKSNSVLQKFSSFLIFISLIFTLFSSNF